MWSSALSEAILGELVKTVQRRNLVFIQTNPAVISMLSGQPAADHFQVVDLCSCDIPLACDEGNLVLLQNFHRLSLPESDPTARLGAAREKINFLLDKDIGVCLASAAPRISYPSCPGSSILLDAHFFYPDRAVRKALGDTPPDRTISSCWPDEVEEAEMKACLRNLGLDVLSALDFLLFDLQVVSDIPHAQLLDSEWDALRGAGLVSVQPDDSEYMSICVSPAKLTQCVADVISDSLGVQATYSVVAEGLVNIERRIRHELRQRAIAAFGAKWRGQAFGGDMATRAVKRASDIAAASESMSIKSLRDPFEWLTLGELLELVTDSNCPDHLGISLDSWRRFGHDILPIRNRVSHMRLLRSDDVRLVQYWRIALERKLRPASS